MAVNARGTGAAASKDDAEEGNLAEEEEEAANREVVRRAFGVSRGRGRGGGSRGREGWMNSGRRRATAGSVIALVSCRRIDVSASASHAAADAKEGTKREGKERAEMDWQLLHLPIQMLLKSAAS